MKINVLNPLIERNNRMRKEQYIQSCCTGCGLCHAVYGTEISKDEKGFIRPENIRGEVLETLCPTYLYMAGNHPFSLWGDYVSVYKGYSANEEIRFRASSGGALTAISIYLLEHNIVDAIIHTGVSNSNPMETQTYISRTTDEIKSHMGSRYAVSSPLMDLLQIVQPGKNYAFVGKPCDVAALKRYMNANPHMAEQIKITLSFFCAGVPSASINEKLLEKMGGHKSRLKTFQYRGNGWPGYTTAIETDGTECKMSYQEAWGKYLGRDVNKICRYCMDGIGEFADIACADLWYLKDGNPDFTEHQGRNIIFCRSANGESTVQKANEAGYLVISDASDIMLDFDKYQPYQFSRRVTMKTRLLALKLFCRFAPRYDMHLLREANAFSTKNMNWKIFKGTVKRVLQGKL